MQKIMFNDRYGLTEAVLDGYKTMTRRIVPKALLPNDRGSLLKMPRFKVGDEVAVAQKYSDCFKYVEIAGGRKTKKRLAGLNNKMFVKAELMPHRIRITDIRVERLQDISDEDCLREGIKEESSFPHKKSCPFYLDGGKHGWDNHFSTPREAFAALIDKVSDKGTWESNPYVWVYSFELLK